MARRHVVVDGREYVPVDMLKTIADPHSRAVARLVAAAIEAVRADDDVDEAGGLQRVNASIMTLKRAVRAIEREAAKCAAPAQRSL